MPHREPTPENFKPIAFTHKEVVGLSEGKYRIYRSHGDYIVVEAENAQKALAGCGVENPLRVMRDTSFLDNVVILQDPAPVAPEPVREAVAEAAAAPVEAETAAPEPVEAAPAAPAAEEALSSEDVEKLLNN